MKMKENQVRYKFQSLISNLSSVINESVANRPVLAYEAGKRALEIAGKLRDEFVKE